MKMLRWATRKKKTREDQEMVGVVEVSKAQK